MGLCREFRRFRGPGPVFIRDLFQISAQKPQVLFLAGLQNTQAFFQLLLGILPLHCCILLQLFTVRFRFLYDPVRPAVGLAEGLTVQTLHGGQQFFGLHPVRRLLSQLRAQLHQFMPLSFILIHKIDRKRAKLLQHGIDLIDIIIFSLGHIDIDLVKIIQNLCHILFACPVDCS